MDADRERRRPERDALRTPLLADDEASSSNQSLVSQEDRGQEVAEVQKVESCSSKALIIILSLQFLEITAFYGVYLNLIVYLQDVLHGDGQFLGRNYLPHAHPRRRRRRLLLGKVHDGVGRLRHSSCRHGHHHRVGHAAVSEAAVVRAERLLRPGDAQPEAGLLHGHIPLRHRDRRRQGRADRVRAGATRRRRRRRQERAGAGEEGVLLQLVLRGGQRGHAC